MSPDGWNGWRKTITVPAVTDFGGAVTITARAMDVYNKYGYASFGKAAVGTPWVSPSYVKSTRSFKTYAYLYPKHTSGSTALEFIFKRYEKKSGHYRWVTKTHPSAKVYNYNTYSRGYVSKKLWKGKWSVQAKHSDATHGTVYSAVRKFTVH